MTSQHTATSFVSTVSPSSDDSALYQLIKRSDINAVEVEDSSAQSVEVSVLWQSSILHVAHLDATQDFALTSATARGEDSTRFVVDGEVLMGLTDARVIVQDAGETRFVFLPGCTGEVEIRGEKRSLSDLIAQGHAKPSTDIHGAYEAAVVSGGRYRMELSGLSVVAKVVARGRRFANPVRTDRRLLASTLGSMLAIAGLLGAARFSVTDDSGMLSAEGNDSRMAELRDFMSRQSERQMEPQPQEALADRSAAGQAAENPSGTAGSRESRDHNRRAEHVSRPNVSHTPTTAREYVGQRGILGLLGGSATQRTGTAFDRMDLASGTGERDADGSMDGDLVGDSEGNGGWGRIGTGEGGGGDGRDVMGVGRIGTRGGGTCLPGQDCRYSLAGAHRLTNRVNVGPTVRADPHPEISGMIAPDVIRRVVQRNLGRVNHCYEQGLASNPQLAGRVAIRFTIAGGGSVTMSSVLQSSLGAPNVASCIAEVVHQMNFPVPEESRLITVTYPFSLMPADH